MNFPAVYLRIRNDLQKDRFRFRTFMLRAPRAVHQKTVCLISDGLSDMRKESPESMKQPNSNVFCVQQTASNHRSFRICGFGSHSVRNRQRIHCFQVKHSVNKS